MWFGKRGLVAKISGDYCIILTGKGTYERIPVPPQGARVGAEVSYSFHTAIAPALRPMTLVASLLILFVCCSLFRQAGLPAAAAYVSLDINPSLEMSVDKNLNVIDVKSFNNDAANLLAQERLKGKNLYDALTAVINEAITQNYIKTGQENLIVSTVTPSGTGTVPVDQQSVQQFLEKSVNKGGLTGEVRTYSATGEFRTEAENEGLSPGKYLIYEQLKQTGNQVSIDDARNNSISKLVDTYKLSLLPNYENIRIQRGKKDTEPDVTVDDNGRFVSIPDFFKDHSGERPAPPQKTNAVNGQGVQQKRNVQRTQPKKNVQKKQPKKNVQSTQPSGTTPSEINQNDGQVTGSKSQRRKVSGTGKDRRDTGLPTGISTYGPDWNIQQYSGVSSQ